MPTIPVTAGVIAALTTDDLKTVEAFQQHHNRRFLLSDTSMESAKAYLILKFTTPPRDGTTHFFIEWSDQADVQIGKSKERVSNRHLLLGFNASRQLVVKDVSTHGSKIEYLYEGNGEHRTLGNCCKPSTWVIPPGWQVRMRVGPYTFDLATPEASVVDAWYYHASMTGFMRRARPVLPALIPLPRPQSHASSPGTLRYREIMVRERVLGYGGYGVVYQVHNSATWKVFAGKQILDKKELAYEVRMVAKLHHPRIVKFLTPVPAHPGEARPEDMLYMEYYWRGDLDTECNRQPLTAHEVAQVALQMSDVLAYLHAPAVKVVHRDIKPANILVKSRTQLEVVLSDFGASCADDGKMWSAGVCTAGYIAPELHTGDRMYTNKVDVWSLGVVLLGLIGYKPDKEGNEMESEGAVQYGTKAGDCSDRMPRPVLARETCVASPRAR